MIFSLVGFAGPCAPPGGGEVVVGSRPADRDLFMPTASQMLLCGIGRAVRP